MADPRLEDHAVGVELQIVELVERMERARIQGEDEEADRLEREIAGLQAELARTAEKIAGDS